MERENGNLAQDDLYMVLVIWDYEYARNLKTLNAQGKLTFEGVKQNKVKAMYWYSSEVSIFSMRNSAYKSKHNVIEQLIIVSMQDVNPLVRL